MTVDIAIFTVLQDTLNVLLVKRPDTDDEHFRGRWALPGGFIDVARDDDLAGCAQRKLKEKTGLRAPWLEQVRTVGNRSRDPRAWSVTTLYSALLPAEQLRAGGNAADVRWHPVPRGDDAPAARLAFDHRVLLQAATEQLRRKTEYSSLPVYLLPDEFTLPELQRIFEIVLDKALDKKAFRTRMLATDLLEPTEHLRETRRRPAQLYRVRDRSSLQYFGRVFGG